VHICTKGDTKVSKWYDDVVDHFITSQQAHEDDALLVFVLRCARRAGQQVARYDPYVTQSFNYRLGRAIEWHRVKVTFVDGSWVRGWRYDGHWKYADRTWERWQTGKQWWAMNKEARQK
jgi:hypothetical protein